MGNPIASLSECEELRRENEELRRRLAESEDALRAIHEGQVDAIVVSGASGPQVFSLRGSETVYRLAVETMLEAAINVTPDGGIVFCNERFGEFVGQPLSAIVGRPIFNFLPPESVESLREFLAACQRQPVQGRFEFAGLEGQRVAVHLSGRALEQPGGTTICLVAADLTELENSARQLEVLREHRQQMAQSQEHLRAARRAALNLMEDALAARESAERSALALCASEERFRGTFENAAVGMAHVSLDGHWLRVNEKLCEIIGYSRDELLAKTFAEVTHPDDLEADWALARQVQNGEIPNYTMDKRYVRKGGRSVWVGLTVSLERQADGSPDYFIAVVRDISDRKRFEAELRASELFLRRVLENLSAFVAVVSPAGTVIDVNRRPMEEAGLKTEGLIGEKFWDVAWWCHDPDLQAMIKDSLQRAGAGELVRYDTVMRITDEERIWVDLQIAPLRDHGGEITHLIFSALDITGRRQAELALRASEERLRLAAQATGFGTYDYDPAQGQEVWSPELYLITGVTWTTLPTFALLAELVHPDDVAGFMDVVRRALKPGEGTRHELEYRIIRPCDGEVRWVRDVGRTFFEMDDDDHSARSARVVGTVQDITRRKQAELQLEASLRYLQEAQDQLVRRERLATLGQLAGGVAHELRTPLGVIRNAVYYLEHALPPTETMKQILGEVQRAIGSSDHIIAEMLDFVREPSLEKAVFPVRRVIAGALQMVPLPAGVRLLGPNGAVETLVEGNEDQITRVLVNLIQNGVQAMDRTGDLEILVERQAAPGEAGPIWVCVRDTGCGIPSENLAKIFDPLFTTKTRGIGLGLAISMRYAQMNNGALSVESKVGSGTTFRLLLQGVSAQTEDER